MPIDENDFNVAKIHERILFIGEYFLIKILSGDHEQNWY